MEGAPQRAHRVPPDARGRRLDQHLAEALPELTRSRLKALIDAGLAQVDGRVAKASHRLKGGEEVRLTVPPPPPAEAAPQELPLEVLHEDEDLLVLDKAPGMVVHPAAGHWEGTLVNALLFRLGGVLGQERRVGLVHRLDKETSGCLVVAKSERALERLQAAFKSREVEKVYLALVHGAPPSEGTFRTLFGRHPVHRKRFTGKVRKGKEAITHFRLREQLEGAALLEVRLETGRTHQIRVHLSEAGHPLLGDEAYGGTRRGATARVRAAQEAIGRVALHAWRLSVEHPRTGRRVRFEAPIPEDFRRALQALRS